MPQQVETVVIFYWQRMEVECVRFFNCHLLLAGVEPIIREKLCFDPAFIAFDARHEDCQESPPIADDYDGSNCRDEIHRIHPDIAIPYFLFIWNHGYLCVSDQ